MSAMSDIEARYPSAQDDGERCIAECEYTCGWSVTVPPTIPQFPRPVADHTVCETCSHANYAHCSRNGCRAIVGKDGNDFVLCGCKEAT